MKFIEAIEEHRGSVYEVGGTVRDSLLKIPNKDKDLVVTGIPLEDLFKLLQPFGHAQWVGKSFGVLKFRPHQSSIEYDIALPRTEKSLGIGHRDFQVTYDPFLPIEQDLGRRDFTINALARHYRSGQLIDLFGGQQDLNHKILRQVFEHTFEEDPLRMLRAIQFASRFALTIEPKTFQAIVEHSPLISSVSSERIIEEIRKIFLAPKPSQGFMLLAQSKLLHFLFPELEALPRHPHFQKMLQRLDHCCQSTLLEQASDLEILFASVFYETGKKPEIDAIKHVWLSDSALIAKRWLTQYRATMLRVQPEVVSRLIQTQEEFRFPISRHKIRLLMAKLGKKLVLKWIDFKLVVALSQNLKPTLKKMIQLKEQIKAELDQNPPTEVRELALNGSDLLALGYQAGPNIGKLLEFLLSCVLKDPLQNQRHPLIKRLKRKFPLPQKSL